MAFLNSNYLKLKAGYLFPEINRRVKAYTDSNPDGAARLIRCGIGDVTEPLPAAVREAMHKAVDELGERTSFRGYGPEQGYEFLRQAIAGQDYRARGMDIADDEIFVSDGSKCDCGNILDIFGSNNRIGVMDPVYPVYVDTNVMAGHTGEADESGLYSGLVYLPCDADNGFVPAIPAEKVDLIYLCYPNNPTGATATRAQLTAWVEYALANDAVIVAAARVAGNAATRRNMVMQLVWLAACVAIGHANNGARRWHKLVRIHALLYVLAEVGHFAATNFSQPLRKVRAVRSFIGAANSIQRKARASQRGKNFTRQRMVNFAVIYSVFMAHGAPRIWCHA